MDYARRWLSTGMVAANTRHVRVANYARAILLYRRTPLPTMEVYCAWGTHTSQSIWIWCVKCAWAWFRRRPYMIALKGQRSAVTTDSLERQEYYQVQSCFLAHLKMPGDLHPWNRWKLALTVLDISQKKPAGSTEGSIINASQVINNRIQRLIPGTPRWLHSQLGGCRYK